MGAADIILGPATIWLAPVGNDLPDENAVGYGDSWGGAWEKMGLTKTPTSMSYSYEKFEAFVQEGLGALKRIKTSEELVIETTLAELTADNLALGLTGDVTTTAASGAQVGKEEMLAGGQHVLPQFCVGLEGLYETDAGAQFPLRVLVYKATIVMNGPLTFGKADYPGITLRIEAMEDPSKTVGERLIKVQKVLAPASGVVAASLTTALAGANNDLKFTAETPGTGGNAITVEYSVAGNNTPLSIDVLANDITVNVATNVGGTAISTAASVMGAINEDGDASALVEATLAPGSNGTGVVTAMAPTNLTGGVNA